MTARLTVQVIKGERKDWAKPAWRLRKCANNGLVHDVTDTGHLNRLLLGAEWQCSWSIFMTFKGQLLTNRMRSGVQNCCVSIFWSINAIDTACDVLHFSSPLTFSPVPGDITLEEEDSAVLKAHSHEVQILMHCETRYLRTEHSASATYKGSPPKPSPQLPHVFGQKRRKQMWQLRNDKF